MTNIRSKDQPPKITEKSRNGLALEDSVAWRLHHVLLWDTQVLRRSQLERLLLGFVCWLVFVFHLFVRFSWECSKLTISPDYLQVDKRFVSTEFIDFDSHTGLIHLWTLCLCLFCIIMCVCVCSSEWFAIFKIQYFLKCPC